MAFGAGPSLQEGLQTLASWALVVYGATLVVTGSRLTQPMRETVTQRWPKIGYLMSCPMCFGWWVGSVYSFILPSLSPIQTSPWFLAAPLNGFAAVSTCWVFHVVLASLGAENL